MNDDGNDEANWNELCRQASIERDPVKFLELTMQIMKFLAIKQNLLDAEYDEAERVRQAARRTEVKSDSKYTVN